MSSKPDTKNSDSELSLDNFFYQAGDANLDNCDAEPIHLIGSVQPRGFLLAFDLISMCLTAYSENCSLLFPVDYTLADQVTSISTHFPDLAREIDATYKGRAEHQHILLDTTVTVSDELYQCVYHEHKHTGFVELVPESGLTVVLYRQKLRILRRYCTDISRAPTFARALELAAEAGRAITDFARIKIYHFQADWSGKVVAESKAKHMPSYLGLMFPDTDIPKQARFLMKLVPFRGVSAVDDEVADVLTAPATPDKDVRVDMSWSLLRSVSRMHTAYLRNMGVQASFSVSLMHEDELWGLIACHNDAPGFLPFDLWGAMQDLAATLMVKLDQERAKESTAMLRSLRHIEEQVAETIRQEGKLEDAIRELMPSLKSFMRADGFAFLYSTNIYKEGKTPSDNFIFELIEWASVQEGLTGTFETESLHRLMPSARAEIDTACGVLIEPIELNRVCYLIWFRGPVTKTVNWAGSPQDKILNPEADGSLTLQPRNSFASWIEKHCEESERWTEAERLSAREILTNMLDIVASQLSLTALNKKHEAFSYAAAHDLKAPLRHIRYALDEIKNVDGTLQDREAVELVELASASSERLQRLVDSITAYLVLENREIDQKPVAMGDVLDDIARFYQLDVEDAGGTLSYCCSYQVIGSEDLLYNLFANLLSNAVKYRSADRALRISVADREIAGKVEIVVEDNGQGIPSDRAEFIFEPFKRLHSQGKVAGSGLGLAICKRIAEMHGGDITLDTSVDLGARFIVTLRKHQ